MINITTTIAVIIILLSFQNKWLQPDCERPL